MNKRAERKARFASLNEQQQSTILERRDRSGDHVFNWSARPYQDRNPKEIIPGGPKYRGLQFDSGVRQGE